MAEKMILYFMLKCGNNRVLNRWWNNNTEYCIAKLTYSVYVTIQVSGVIQVLEFTENLPRAVLRLVQIDVR